MRLKPIIANVLTLVLVELASRKVTSYLNRRVFRTM